MMVGTLFILKEFIVSASIYGFFNAFSAVGTPSICLELFGMDLMVTIMGCILVREFFYNFYLFAYS